MDWAKWAKIKDGQLDYSFINLTVWVYMANYHVNTHGGISHQVHVLVLKSNRAFLLVGTVSRCEMLTLIIRI